MRHRARDRWASLLLATLILSPAAAGPASGGEPSLTAKGIYHDVDRYQRSGLKFRIVMDDGDRKRYVPTTYPFHTGDRFTFRFEINRDTHVYVINRTRTRSTAVVTAGYRAKGVEHRTRLGEPRLLFPTARAGSDNRLASRRAHTVPSQGYFMMDDQSGIEKLYVVISDRRLDFSDVFAADTGELRRGARSRTAALQARLDGWKANALVQLVPKGIVHEVDGYGASVNASRPAVIEIDLKHYR